MKRKITLLMIAIFSCGMLNAAETNFNAGYPEKEDIAKIQEDEEELRKKRIGELNIESGLRIDVSEQIDGLKNQLLRNNGGVGVGIIEQYAKLLQNIQSLNNSSLKRRDILMDIGKELSYIHFCKLKGVNNERDFFLRENQIDLMERLTLNNNERVIQMKEAQKALSDFLSRRPNDAQMIEIMAFQKCFGGNIPVTPEELLQKIEEIKLMNKAIKLKEAEFTK